MVKSTEHVSRLEERNRLAARIHDEIGHGMSGSILLLEGASSVMDSDPEKARDTIHKVTENLRDSVEEIRKVLREERSAGAEISLARIENELTAFEANHPNLKTNFVSEGDMGDVNGAVWTCVYENMIEALTNMLKHSAATLFTVSMKNSGGLLRVEFFDNGGNPGAGRGNPKKSESINSEDGGRERTSIGVDRTPDNYGRKRLGVDNRETPNIGDAAEPVQKEIKTGIGLQNMEDRVALCYGRCFFRHESDGFHIIMTFPRRGQ
jgi:signal transduction histidine kinase